jgi:acyl-CoA thioesterase FadM
MGRPISPEYRSGRRLFFGVTDPSGLNLAFELDGSRVYTHVDPKKLQTAGPQMVTTGLVMSVADDLAHATVAALKKRIGVTRETRLRFLKPLYKDEIARADGTVTSAAGDVVHVLMRLLNAKDQLCVEGEIEIFLLGADQVRRMTPDGMVPADLKRFLP